MAIEVNKQRSLCEGNRVFRRLKTFDGEMNVTGIHVKSDYIYSTANSRLVKRQYKTFKHHGHEHHTKVINSPYFTFDMKSIRSWVT